tara:strand:+ start:4156 stop:4551 length:396 start_codon:yes stop_codon:yes gene_type:complete
MRLSDILVDSLKPYQSQLSAWTKTDLELLFMGFGNIKIVTPAGQIFYQTFTKNAVDICLALNKLGFEDMEWNTDEVWYLIYAQPGRIRKDLVRCIENNGNKILPTEGIEGVEVVFEFFDAENGIDFESEEE